MDQYSPNQSAGFAVCDACGEKLGAAATFCPNCGSRRITRHSGAAAKPVGNPYQYNMQSGGSARRLVSAGGAYSSRVYRETADGEKNRAPANAELPRTPAAPAAPAEPAYVPAPAAPVEPAYTRPPVYPADAAYENTGYEDDDYYGEEAPYEDESVEYYTDVQMVVTVIVVAFLAIVLTIALTGFIASLFVGSGNSSSYGEEYTVESTDSTTQANQDATKKTTKKTAKVESEIRFLPSEITGNQYERFTLEKNKFGAAMASSYIKSGNLTSGTTGRAFDGNPKTCWQDGVDGYGEGEWLLTYNSDSSAVEVSSVTVYNGYQNEKYNTEKKDMYKYNSRVKAFTLEFDDGSTETFTLKDKKDAQTFKFDKRETCYVRFTVNSVYKGSKYKDTCIGEIIYR